MRDNHDDNIFLDGASGELTFGKIFKILKFSLLRMLVYILIACLIAGAVSAVLFAVNSTEKNVSTKIKYDYVGIDSGLDPNGDVFNKNRIKNTNVLSNAIQMSGMAENKKLNSSTLSSHLVIEDIIPDNVLALKLDLEANLNKKPDVNSEIAKLEYYANQFMIYIKDYDELGLDATDAVSLLDNVVKSHQLDWTNTYVQNPVLSTELFEELAAGHINYEYMHYQPLLNFELTRLETFLDANKGVKFISSQGVKYSDLISELNTFRTTEYNSCNAFINTNRITDDPAELVSSLENSKADLTYKNKILDSRIQPITDVLNNFKPTRVVIPNPNGGEPTVEYSYPSQYYAKFHELNKLVDEQAIIKAQIEITEQKITELTAGGTLTPSSPELIAKASEKLTNIAKDFLNIANKAQTLTDEYKAKVSLTNSVKAVTPAIKDTKKTISNKAIIATFVVAIVAAIVASIVVTVKSQKKFAFKKLAELGSADADSIDSSANDESVESIEEE